MGCCNCKPLFETPGLDSSPEEAAIYRGESDHPFSLVQARALISELLLNDRNGRVPLRNFKRVCRNLRIPYYPSIETKPGVKAYFDRQTCGDSLDTESLVVTSILLGQGRYSRKLKLWLEYYDADAKGFVETSRLKKMIELLLNISCTRLPFLSVDELGPVRVNSYIDSLRRQIQGTTAYCLFLAAAGAHSAIIQQLEYQFAKHTDLQHLLTSRGARNLCNVNFQIGTKFEEGSFSQTNDNSLQVNERSMFVRREQREDEGPQLPLPIREESYLTSKFSISEMSAEPIVIKVELADHYEDFVMYPDENPLEVVESFAQKHSLSDTVKGQLTHSLQQIWKELNP